MNTESLIMSHMKISREIMLLLQGACQKNNEVPEGSLLSHGYEHK